MSTMQLERLLPCPPLRKRLLPKRELASQAYCPGQLQRWGVLLVWRPYCHRNQAESSRRSSAATPAHSLIVECLRKMVIAKREDEIKDTVRLLSLEDIKHAPTNSWREKSLGIQEALLFEGNHKHTF